MKKVVWTSARGWTLPDGGGSIETEAVTERALMTLGTQLREGNSESVTADLVQPRIGQNTVDVVPRPGYALSTELHWYFTPAPPIQQMGPSGMSFYGTEFEIADKAGVFGDYPYYRQAVLNMMRKGFNYAIFPSLLRTRDNGTQRIRILQRCATTSARPRATRRARRPKPGQCCRCSTTAATTAHDATIGAAIQHGDSHQGHARSREHQ